MNKVLRTLGYINRKGELQPSEVLIDIAVVTTILTIAIYFSS